MGSKEEAEGEVGASQAELCEAGEQLAGLQSGGWREDFESFIYFKNALWLQRGTLGAFDSDPPAECLPAAPLSRAPSLSAQWVLASGPAASDLTRLCA